MSTDTFESIFGSNLRHGKNEVNATATLTGAKYVGIYFGAHWAPPCRLFNEKLADFYKRANEGGRNIEVVFVSVDGNEAAFERHYEKHGPWLAVPYKDTARIASLKQRYGINGLPTLIVLDETVSQVSDDGRQDILNSEGSLVALENWEKIRQEAAK